MNIHVTNIFIFAYWNAKMFNMMCLDYALVLSLVLLIGQETLIEQDNECLLDFYEICTIFFSLVSFG